MTSETVAHQAPLSSKTCQSSFRFMSMESVMPSSHLILCCPLLLLPSVFPSTGVFSNESALHITWPKYWSFSFSISSSNDYSGLISFGIDTPELVSSMFSSHLPLHAVCTAGDSLCSAHSGNVFLLLRAFGNVGCSPIPFLDLRKPSKSAFCLTQAVYFPQLIP